MRKYSLLLLTFLCTGSFLPAEMPQSMEVPPLANPATHQLIPGKFVWGDLFAEYPLQAAKFYSQVFGWNLRRLSSDENAYWIMFNGDRPVAGVMRHQPKSARPGSLQARWVGYISVGDIDLAVEKVKAQGGEILMQPFQLSKRGNMAIVADNEGTIVGLIQSSSGDPEDQEPAPGNWAWVQLFSRNPTNSVSFYSSVFGYEVAPDSRTERSDDHLLYSQGIARAGLVPLEAPEGSRGGWMGFVMVSDIDGCIKTARELGSQILVAPESVNNGEGDRLAVITDPLGGVVGLIQFQN